MNKEINTNSGEIVKVRGWDGKSLGVPSIHDTNSMRCALALMSAEELRELIANCQQMADELDAGKEKTDG